MIGFTWGGTVLEATRQLDRTVERRQSFDKLLRLALEHRDGRDRIFGIGFSSDHAATAI
ncbi:MAG TPA: hypothetical protein VE951_07140 [Candidatus Angelobacter sp.]|nr:hypothetical protein [Candidatus Angelobacter sp.]